MKKYILQVSCLLMIIITACTPPQKSLEEVQKEAEAFMTDYAVELNQRNGKAISKRYDKDGWYVVGNGKKTFRSYDATVDIYENRWDGPESFFWEDLSFEILNENQVMILGRFKWVRLNTQDTVNFSYTSLLVRKNGEFKIRLENESTNGGPILLKNICRLLKTDNSEIRNKFIENLIDADLVSDLLCPE